MEHNESISISTYNREDLGFELTRIDLMSSTTKYNYQSFDSTTKAIRYFIGTCNLLIGIVGVVGNILTLMSIRFAMVYFHSYAMFY